jgi:hypothetical protein
VAAPAGEGAAAIPCLHAAPAGVRAGSGTVATRQLDAQLPRPAGSDAVAADRPTSVCPMAGE